MSTYIEILGLVLMFAQLVLSYRIYKMSQTPKKPEASDSKKANPPESI